MGPIGTGDWGLGLGLDNKFNLENETIFDNFMLLHSSTINYVFFLPSFKSRKKVEVHETPKDTSVSNQQ